MIVNLMNRIYIKIYDLFEASLMTGITKHTDVKPYVLETVGKTKRIGN